MQQPVGWDFLLAENFPNTDVANPLITDRFSVSLVIARIVIWIQRFVPDIRLGTRNLRVLQTTLDDLDPPKLDQSMDPAMVSHFKELYALHVDCLLCYKLPDFGSLKQLRYLGLQAALELAKKADLQKRFLGAVMSLVNLKVLCVYPMPPLDWQILGKHVSLQRFYTETDSSSNLASLAELPQLYAFSLRYHYNFQGLFEFAAYKFVTLRHLCICFPWCMQVDKLSADALQKCLLLPKLETLRAEVITKESMAQSQIPFCDLRDARQLCWFELAFFEFFDLQRKTLQDAGFSIRMDISDKVRSHSGVGRKYAQDASQSATETPLIRSLGDAMSSGLKFDLDIEETTTYRQYKQFLLNR